MNIKKIINERDSYDLLDPMWLKLDKLSQRYLTKRYNYYICAIENDLLNIENKDKDLVLAQSILNLSIMAKRYKLEYNYKYSKIKLVVNGKYIYCKSKNLYENLQSFKYNNISITNIIFDKDILYIHIALTG